MEIKKSADAFVEKLHSVSFFKDFYTKEASLTEVAILETDDQSNKKYALVRVFVDLSKKQQPYVIFVDNKKGVVFIDLISTPSTLEEIIKKHEKCSINQPIFGTGTLNTENGVKFLNEGKVDDLAAALLWSINSETNLNPKIGLDIVKKFLSPLY